MPTPVLVDTSAWIEALRPDGDEIVRRKVHAALDEGTAVFCDLVLLELWNGARGDREASYLRKLQRELDTLPTTAEVWARSQELARQYRREGVTVPASDLLITACATQHGVGLLHRDGHFDQIEDATHGEG